MTCVLPGHWIEYVEASRGVQRIRLPHVQHGPAASCTNPLSTRVTNEGVAAVAGILGPATALSDTMDAVTEQAA